MATEGVVRDGFVDVATGPAVELGSDASLVRHVIEGSQEALAALYDRHADAVFSAAMRASRDRWIAAEIVQETFLALWNRAEQFDPSRGTLRAWLATIARNRAIDRLRSAARHQRAANFSSYARTEADDQSVVEWLTASGELIGVAGPELGPEIALSDKETRASIEEALASLDPVERRVIVLAYDGGLSQSEIATSLGWPIGTVKTRTRRALHRLRDRLERPGGGVPAEVRGAEHGARANTGSTHSKRRAPRPGECLAPC
jgi:RNA polymerase sigma-70 factor (ECF subfamily)